MNKDFEKRDSIIFGDYNRNRYFGGCAHFRCSYETMKKLVDEDFVDLDETQNYSPTTKDFMEYLEDVDYVQFIGYAISPVRTDYRITIEGADVIISDKDNKKLTDLVGLLIGADEFNIDHDDGKYYLHAWWD